jgi:hypothetical protein
MKRRYRVSFLVEVEATKKGQGAFSEAVPRQEFFFGWYSHSVGGPSFSAEPVVGTTTVEEVKP